MLLESPSTRWVAVEPNEKNLGYARDWQWRSQIVVCPSGLSESGGRQTLYVTNVDSGSSLLPPEIPPSMAHRVQNLDYFFPVTERSIDTLSLADVIQREAVAMPVLVKLDTQGSELSILKGADHYLRTSQVVGIEMEASLLAQPLMKGSSKLWQACQYLEDAGFEMLDVHPIFGASRFSSGKVRVGKTFLNECDAMFAVRPDIAATLPAPSRAALLAFYVCNQLFEEAAVLLASDADLAALLASGGCDVRALDGALRAAV